MISPTGRWYAVSFAVIFIGLLLLFFALLRFGG